MKEQGRFKIYEGDEPPPFSPPVVDGSVLMEEAMTYISSSRGPLSTTSSTVDENEAQDGNNKEAKRKGRFLYVEQEDGGKSLAKMASNVSLDRIPAPSSGAPGVGVLHNALKDLLESAQQQHENMREMTAAVADAEKGKYGALNAYLMSRRSFHSPADFDRLKAELQELRAENAKLKEENAKLKQESSAAP